MKKSEEKAQLKGERDFPVGKKVKGSAVITPQGEFVFTPSGKIDPEDYKGMKMLFTKREDIGSWSVCQTSNKVCVRITVPKVKKDIMLDAIRDCNEASRCWIIGNYK